MALTPPFEGLDLTKAAKSLGNSVNSLSRSAISAANNVSNGLTAQKPPSQSGLSTRQAQVQPNRAATSKRQVMRWLIPEQPMVEMYINPNQIQYGYKKLISPQRVKGGYVLQYWGEDLTTLRIDGTTGTSGIEGINVLMDVYRNEQLMFDPYALFLQSERDKAEQESFDDILFGEGGPFGIENIPILGDILGDTVTDSVEGALTSNVVNSRNKPTLASLAFTVEMYWGGEVYRGYFENFDFSESSEKIGLFYYNFTFKVTQKRGFRTNFFPWHKHPSYGQSNWDAGGPPLSYSTSSAEYVTSTRKAANEIIESVGNEFNSTNNKLLNNAMNEQRASLIDIMAL